MFLKTTRGASLFQAHEDVNCRAYSRGILISTFEDASRLPHEYMFDHCDFDETTQRDLSVSIATQYGRSTNVSAGEKDNQKEVKIHDMLEEKISMSCPPTNTN